MTINMTELDERIIELAKREMAAKGWTQKALGQAMGLAESEISLLMNRKRTWTRNLIELFNKATGITVEIQGG